MKEQDEYFMLLALEASRNAVQHCAPNPPVGCVVVRNNEVISEGYTQVPGQAHAEVDALKNLSKNLFDLILYVTLEPCSFFGRTPSCAQTIAADPRINKVVVAVIDPDPRNNGKGLEILRSAGKEVVLGVAAEKVSQFLFRV